MKKFTNSEIESIVNLYINDKKSVRSICKLFNVSVTPIKRILKDNNLLRKGYSNGSKIELSETQSIKIKNLYLNENKNSLEISKIMELTKSFIDKHLHNSDYRRTRSEAISLSQKGLPKSMSTRAKMKVSQMKLAKSGNRKQTGGYCKFFKIQDLTCQGTYEKFYIELLIENKKLLPKDGKSINTPYGVYYPDFEYLNKIIEIKSSYTYDVLYGVKPNRFTKKVDLSQLKKIEWVNKNIKPIEIIIVDKRANKLIKKII